MTASIVLSNLAYVTGAVVLAIIVSLIVMWRYRKPKSIEGNLKTFNRGLQALAPPSATRNEFGAVRRLPPPAVDQEVTERVRVLRADQRRTQALPADGQHTEAEAG